jgi:hypothetical protein
MHLRSILLLALTASVSAQNLVYDNGPFQTAATGGGPAGTSAISQLQTLAPISHTVFGFGAQQAVPNRLVDQFTVNSFMQVDEIEVFGYTTGSAVVSATGVYLSIWDGNPATGTPTQLIAGAGNAVNLIGAPGFTSTNTFTNVYRVLDTGVLTTQTTRNIQSVRVALQTPVVLTAGTYYLEFSFNGINFVPPVSTKNVSATGDAQQFTNATLAYANILNGTATAGLPFKFYSSVGAPITAGSITNLGGGCSTAGIEVGGAAAVGGYLHAELTNVNPLAIGALVIGGSDPNAPLFICACVSHASLDVLSVGNVFDLPIPVNASLAGANLFVQGAEIDLLGAAPQPCNLGVAFGLTDGYRFALNFN